MKHSLINQSDERVISLLEVIENLSCILSKMDTRMMRRPLNNEFYLSDIELSKKLKISRSSLQDWRDEGRIPYYKICGKILYRESDIQALLEKGFRDTLK